jgi:SAM-dependent methyltransferase
MQPETYRMLANRQDWYWWHRARRNMAMMLLARHGVPKHGTWVELGCGPGGNLGISAAFQPQMTIGIDISPLAMELARARIAPNVCLVEADLKMTLPLSTGSADVVTIFNVLYHRWVDDEGAVLREVRRVLRPQGLLLMTEPAFPSLRREMDAAAMTRKRYRRSDLVGLCEKAGLHVLFTSYFTSFGFPLLAVFKLAQKLFSLLRVESTGVVAPDMRPLNPTLNDSMYLLAMGEARLICAGTSMPVGTTAVCLARRS